MALTAGYMFFVYYVLGVCFGLLWIKNPNFPEYGYDTIIIVDKYFKFYLTFLYPFYLIWPVIWAFVIPILAYYSAGKKSFWKCIVSSWIFLSISAIIYILLPTYYDAQYFHQYLNQKDPFYDTITWMQNSHFNSIGACPSFHNHWAALFIIFALQKNVKAYFRYPMIFIGLLITFSTIALHQHGFVDIGVTYVLCWMSVLIDYRYKLSEKLGTKFDKIFKR